MTDLQVLPLLPENPSPSHAGVIPPLLLLLLLLLLLYSKKGDLQLLSSHVQRESEGAREASIKRAPRVNARGAAVPAGHPERGELHSSWLDCVRLQ